jgi:hypothetical protein
VLSENQCAKFSQLIADSVMDKSRIKVTLYNPYRDEEYIGIPIVQNSRIRLVTAHNVLSISMDRVIDISPVD